MFGSRKFTRPKTSSTQTSGAQGANGTKSELKSDSGKSGKATLDDVVPKRSAVDAEDACKSNAVSQSMGNAGESPEQRMSKKKGVSKKTDSMKAGHVGSAPAPGGVGRGSSVGVEEVGGDVSKGSAGKATDVEHDDVSACKNADGGDGGPDTSREAADVSEVSNVASDTGCDVSSKTDGSDRELAPHRGEKPSHTTSGPEGSSIAASESKSENVAQESTSNSADNVRGGGDGKPDPDSKDGDTEVMEEEEEIDFSMMEFMVVDEAEEDDTSTNKKKESDRDRRNREKSRHSDNSSRRHERSRSGRAHSRDSRKSDGHSKERKSSKDRSKKDSGGGHSREDKSSRDHAKKDTDKKSNKRKSNEHGHNDGEKSSKSSKTSDSKSSAHKKETKSDVKKAEHKTDIKKDSKKSDIKKDDKNIKKENSDSKKSKDSGDHKSKSGHKKSDDAKKAGGKKTSETSEGVTSEDHSLKALAAIELVRPTPVYSAEGIEELDSNAVWWRWNLGEQCIVKGCEKAPQSVQSYQNHWNSMHVPRKVTNIPCPLFATSSEKSRCRAAHFDGKLESIGYDDLEQHLRRYHKYPRDDAKQAAASCERITRRVDPPDLGFIFTDGVLHEPREDVMTQPRVPVPPKVFEEWKPGDKCPVSWCKKVVEDAVSMLIHWNAVHLEYVPYLWCNMCSQSRHHNKIFYTKKKMALIPHLTKDHHKDVDEATAIVEKTGYDFKLVLNEEYIPVNERFFEDEEPLHTDTDRAAEERLELCERILQLGPMTFDELASAAVFKWMNVAHRFNVDFHGIDRGFLELEFFSRADVDDCIKDLKIYPETKDIKRLHLKPSKNNNVPEGHPSLDIDTIVQTPELFEKMSNETLVLSPLPSGINEEMLLEKIQKVDVSLLLIPRDDDGATRRYAYVHTKNTTEDLLTMLGMKLELDHGQKVKFGELLQIPRLSAVIAAAGASWLKACAQCPKGIPEVAHERTRNLREYVLRYLRDDSITEQQRRILEDALHDVKWILDENDPSQTGKKSKASKPAKTVGHDSKKARGKKPKPSKTNVEIKAQKEREDKMRKQRATKTQVDRIKQRYAAMKKSSAILPRTAKRGLSPTPQNTNLYNQPRGSGATINKRISAARPFMGMPHQSARREDWPNTLAYQESRKASLEMRKPVLTTASTAVNLLVGLSRVLEEKKALARTLSVERKVRPGRTPNTAPVIDNRHTCLYCDGKHLSEECPQDKQRCGKCGRADHLTKDCGLWAVSRVDERITRSPTLEIICIDCGRIGHLANNCPFNPSASSRRSQSAGRDYDQPRSNSVHSLSARHDFGGAKHVDEYGSSKPARTSSAGIEQGSTFPHFDFGDRDYKLPAGHSNYDALAPASASHPVRSMSVSSDPVRAPVESKYTSLAPPAGSNAAIPVMDACYICGSLQHNPSHCPMVTKPSGISKPSKPSDKSVNSRQKAPVSHRNYRSHNTH